jgi:DNA-binding transcriptional LysR family regulator
VLRGVGLGVVFRCVAAAELAAGQLVTLAVPGLALREQFLLVYRRAQRRPPLERNLLRWLHSEASVMFS